MDTSLTLLERLRQPADRAAWKQFAQLYAPLLLGFARRLGLQDADAADVVQDVFLVLLRKLPEFHHDGRRSFRAWLWTIVRNRIATLQRAPQPGPLGELPASDDLELLWEREHRQVLAQRALRIMQSQFQPATWQACWEHVVAGRSAADVAQELGISVGAVYAARFRVLARLREEMAGLLD